MQFWRATLLLLVLSCFLSFAWAIKRHFVSTLISTLMRLTALFGFVFTALQVFALLNSRSFDTLQLGTSILLYSASLTLFWWTVGVTRAHRLAIAFSTDQPHCLLQTGPYQFVRHPFYVAYSLFWVAGLIAAPRWYQVIAVVVMLALYFSAARMEEVKFASSDLSAPYQAYRSNTGMFLPRLRGTRSNVQETTRQPEC